VADQRMTLTRAQRWAVGGVTMAVVCLALALAARADTIRYTVDGRLCEYPWLVG
jgi:hypothetical protein